MNTGRCVARVALGWGGEQAALGEAHGLTSPSGDLRCAAEACLSALAQAVRIPAFELVGVKAVRAFDATVVIVSLAIRNELGGRRLVGSALVENDPIRGAILAVLHATNRVSGRGPA
jgi:hypothetical protein